MLRRDFLKGLLGVAAAVVIPFKATARVAKLSVLKVTSLFHHPVVAGETISAGQLVFIAEDGKIHLATALTTNGPLGIALQNADAGKPTAMMVQGSIQTQFVAPSYGGIAPRGGEDMANINILLKQIADKPLT